MPVILDGVTTRASDAQRIAPGAALLRVCWIGVALWLAALAPAVHAASQWLEDVRYFERDGRFGIELLFSDSVYYRSHFPPDSSDALTIYLRVPGLNHYEDFPIQEVVSPRVGVAGPLARAAFEANEFEAALRLKFAVKTGYQVSQGSSNKVIVVTLMRPGSTPVPVTAPVVAPTLVPAPAVEGERIKALLTQSRDALTRGDVDQAIGILNGVLSLPQHPDRADALELLGVARERKGQRAHAKAIYGEYLLRFPKEEGVERVRQRLAELLSGDLKPQEKLKEVKAAPVARGGDWSHSGSVAQYYYRGKSDLGGVNTTDQSMLLTQFSWDSQQRGERYDSRAVANLNHTRDFLDRPEDAEINSLYAQIKDKQGGWFAKLGRQSSPGGGVQGRFDGLLGQYNVTTGVQLEVVTGYAGELSAKDTLQTQRPFWSVAADLGPFWDYLEAMPYYVRQDVDGMLDREAVGYELRFFHPLFNAFNMVDYDLSYTTLNTVLLSGQYSVQESTTVYGYYETRRSVTTSNALFGEANADSLKDLLTQYTRDEIRELARKRTGDSTTTTLGASHTYNPKLQISGDVTLSEQVFPLEPVQLGVPRTTQSDRQTYYALQAVTSKWLNGRDTTLIGVRYTGAQDYNSTSFNLALRLPVGAAWRFDASLRYDQRANDTGEHIDKTIPKLVVEYRPTNTVDLQLELSRERWEYSGVTTNESYNRLLASLGYRWLF